MNKRQVLIFALLLIPAISQARLAKIDREDFSQLIVDGIKSSQTLSQEVRKSLGVEAERKEQAKLNADINDKRIRLEIGADHVASPTTQFVRSKPVQLDLEEMNDRRLAEEFNQLGY